MGRSRSLESRVWPRLRLRWRDQGRADHDLEGGDKTQHFLWNGIVQIFSPPLRPVVIWLDNCVVCNCELTPLCQGRALQYWRLTQVPTLHINSHSLTLYRLRHRQITQGRLRPAMNTETNGNGITFNQRLRRRLAEKEKYFSPFVRSVQSCLELPIFIFLA